MQGSMLFSMEPGLHIRIVRRRASLEYPRLALPKNAENHILAFCRPLGPAALGCLNHSLGSMHTYHVSLLGGCIFLNHI